MPACQLTGTHAGGHIFLLTREDFYLQMWNSVSYFPALCNVPTRWRNDLSLLTCSVADWVLLAFCTLVSVDRRLCDHPQWIMLPASLNYTITLSWAFFCIFCRLSRRTLTKCKCPHHLITSALRCPLSAFFFLMLPPFQYYITCQDSHHPLPTTSLEFTLPLCDHTYQFWSEVFVGGMLVISGH